NPDGITRLKIRNVIAQLARFDCLHCWIHIITSYNGRALLAGSARSRFTNNFSVLHQALAALHPKARDSKSNPACASTFSRLLGAAATFQFRRGSRSSEPREFSIRETQPVSCSADDPASRRQTIRVQRIARIPERRGSAGSPHRSPPSPESRLPTKRNHQSRLHRSPDLRRLARQRLRSGRRSIRLAASANTRAQAPG